MSFRLMIAAATLTLPMAPLAAQTVFDTHAEIGAPAGKVPTKMFRPLRSNRCDAAPALRQTGKLPIAPAATVDSRAGCAPTELALSDTARRD